ncbi:hypothetical protein BV898_19223 [Hypsibius exemplaris]|uniref:Reverse transcriptase domain-containing protein n=1 Tax=Hypsibius exemplaris TaxID=2072580 RepID=A0A9X6RNQ7_HYPEX|nr:hypothetical protein BV898_19223 [Hypsibius exemplaris]
MSYDWTKSLGRKKKVDAIFLDCTKAFDRVPHDVVLRSMASHGIDAKSQHFRISLKQQKTQIPGTGSHTFDGAVIPTVSDAKCLGVTFSSILNWTAHIDEICTKARKRVHCINVYFPKKFGAVKQLLFKSLALPVLEYCSTIWSPSSKTSQKKLEDVQRFFLKTVRLSSHRTNHHPSLRYYQQHLREVQWEPLWKRRCRSIVHAAFKAWSGQMPGGTDIIVCKAVVAVARVRTRNNTASTMSQKYFTVEPAGLWTTTGTLEVVSSSFAYVALALLNNRCCVLTPETVGSLKKFTAYISSLDFSNFEWTKKHIAPDYNETLKNAKNVIQLTIQYRVRESFWHWPLQALA